MKRKGTEIYLQYGDDDDPRTIEERARLHERHRGRTVASILAELHLMALAEVLPDNCLIDAKKAYWQDFKGSKIKGTQAAHCVPCQITITGRRPEQFVRKHSTARANEISAFFGKTDKFLPTIFNQCDSRSERVLDANGREVGLVPAFWDACLDVVIAGQIAKGFRTDRIIKDIQAAYNIYKSKAKMAFNATIKAFDDDRRNFLYSSDKDKAKEATTKMKIVKYYKEELASFKAVNQITRFAEISDLISQYKKFKK